MNNKLPYSAVWAPIRNLKIWSSEHFTFKKVVELTIKIFHLNMLEYGGNHFHGNVRADSAGSGDNTAVGLLVLIPLSGSKQTPLALVNWQHFFSQSAASRSIGMEFILLQYFLSLMRNKVQISLDAVTYESLLYFTRGKISVSLSCPTSIDGEWFFLKWI